MNTLIIDQEFRSLIPAMSTDSLAQLDQNIREHGLRDKLVIWDSPNGEVLIDGHHRYEIINRSPGLIAFEVEKLRFASRDEVKLWILQNQIGRRNLSDDQQIAIWTDIGDQRAKISRERQLAVARQAKSAPEAVPGTAPKTVCDKTSKTDKNTRKEIEKESGGKATVRKQRAHQEFKREHPEAYKDVRTGKKTLRQAKKQSGTKKRKLPPIDLSDIDFEFMRAFTEQIRQARAAGPPARKQSQLSPAIVPFAKEIIKQGRRVLAEKHHPDKGGNTDDMAKVNAAEQMLTALLNGISAQHTQEHEKQAVTAVKPTEATEAPATVAPATAKPGRKSKLTPEDIAYIQQATNLGTLTQSALADRFKVSVATVGKIARDQYDRSKPGRKSLSPEKIEHIKDAIRTNVSVNGLPSKEKWGSQISFLEVVADKGGVSITTVRKLIKQLGGVEQIVSAVAA